MFKKIFILSILAIVLICAHINTAYAQNSSLSKQNIEDLLSLSIYQEYDQKIDLPGWKKSFHQDVSDVLKTLNPSSPSHVTRAIHRQILGDSFSDISLKTSSEDDIVSLFDARFQALNKYGFFYETLNLYTKILSITDTPPTSWTTSAIYAFIMTGQIDAACLEISFIDLEKSPLTTLCSAYKSKENAEVSLPSKIETPEEIATFILTLWTKDTPNEWLNTVNSPLAPLAQAALSYQTTLSPSLRYTNLKKAVKSGLVPSQHIISFYETYADSVSTAQAQKWADTPDSAKKQSLPKLYNAIALVHDKKDKASLINSALKKMSLHKSESGFIWIKQIEKIADQAQHFTKEQLENMFALLLMHDAASQLPTYKQALFEKDPDNVILTLADTVFDTTPLTEEKWQHTTTAIQTKFPKTNKKRLKNILSIIHLYGFPLSNAQKDFFDIPPLKSSKNIEKNNLSIIKLLSNDKKQQNNAILIEDNLFQSLKNMHSVKLFSIFDKITLEILSQSVL